MVTGLQVGNTGIPHLATDDTGGYEEDEGPEGRVEGLHRVPGVVPQLRPAREEGEGGVQEWCKKNGV